LIGVRFKKLPKKTKFKTRRVAIVEELYSNGHMNIDDLYKKLLEKFPSISLATIYKNINAMIEKVFLNEVKIPNAKSVYELVKDEHSHLVCSSCGKIEDVDLDISNLVKEATSSKNYTINQASIIFAGVCPDCSK